MLKKVFVLFHLLSSVFVFGKTISLSDDNIKATFFIEDKLDSLVINCELTNTSTKASIFIPDKCAKSGAYWYEGRNSMHVHLGWDRQSTGNCKINMKNIKPGETYYVAFCLPQNINCNIPLLYIDINYVPEKKYKRSFLRFKSSFMFNDYIRLIENIQYSIKI